MQTHYPTPVEFVTAIARDVQSEMATFMSDYGDGLTRETLLQRFTPEQVDRYGPGAARDANRRAERRTS